jgi:hypothetical protein
MLPKSQYAVLRTLSAKTTNTLACGSAHSLMYRHSRENANLFPTYLMTGTYLPSITSLELTQTQTATQQDTVDSSAEPSASADSMQIDDTQETVSGLEDEDNDKTPTKAQLLLDESKPEIGMKSGAEGWPLRDEHIVTRGLLLVGGQEEMEGMSSRAKERQGMC